MNCLVLTLAEACQFHAGMLTEIRRPVEDPPRFWSFMDGLDGVAYPTDYNEIRPSPIGLFIWSVDCRNPQPARTAPLGKPGDLLWIAEPYTREDCGDDGERVIWQADMAAAWFEKGMVLGKVYYLDSDHQPAAKWRSGAEMPKRYSRVTVRLTSVRAERTGDVWEFVYGVEKTETLEARIAMLERRLAETQAELDAVRASNAKLLDPVFRFDGALDVEDTHGLMTVMADSFIALLDRNGAVNFQSFTFARTGSPAIVMTLRRANGKSPEERYAEVAAELAALKGTTPVPLEPQESDAQEEHHCRLDPATGRVWCTLCGDEETLPRPARGDVLIATLRSFDARHAGCPERRAQAVSVDVLQEVW